MLINPEKFNPADEPEADRWHRVTRAVIGASPVLSGTLLEAFNALIENPLDRRRTQWLLCLTEEINKLGIDVAILQENQARSDKILSAILQSTDVAMKSGNSEVTERLIHMVLQTIRDADIEDDLLSVYFSTVRQMSNSHFAVLEFISSREPLGHGGDLDPAESSFLEEVETLPGVSNAIPALRVLRDLDSMELIFSPPKSPTRLSGTNYCTKVLSNFGAEFLQFTRGLES